MGETVPKRVRDIVLAVYRVGDPEHNDRALEEMAVAAVREAVPALARADEDAVRRQLRVLCDDKWLSFNTADGVTRWGVSLRAVREIGLATLKRAREQLPAQPVPASPSNDGDESATPQPTLVPEPPLSSPDQSGDSDTDEGGDKGNGLGERQQQVLSAVSASADVGGWAEDSVIFAALTKQSQWSGAPWYKFTAELRKLVSGGHLERGEGKSRGQYRLASDGAGESGAGPVGPTQDEDGMQGDGEGNGGEDDTEKKGDDEMRGDDDSEGAGAVPEGSSKSGKSGTSRMTYEERRLLGWKNTSGKTPDEKVASEILLAEMQRIFGLGTPGSAIMHARRMIAEGDLKVVRRGVYQWARDISQLGQDNAVSGGEDKPAMSKPGPKKGGVKKPKAGKEGKPGKPKLPSAEPLPVKEADMEAVLSQDADAAITKMSPWFPKAKEAAQRLSALSSEDRRIALKAMGVINQLPVEQHVQAYWLVAVLCAVESSGGGIR